MARNSSLTFMAVFAEVSIKSKPVSSAYVWASFTIQHIKTSNYYTVLKKKKLPVQMLKPAAERN